MRNGFAGIASLALLKPGVAAATQPKRKEAAAPGKRLAVIGGGASGIASAYFCDSDWSIDLFESRDKIGGHADTVSVTEQGRKYDIDIGAEFFHPNTHPLYWSFLEEIGARDADDPSKGLVIEGPANVTVFDQASGKPLFSSDHVLDDLGGALHFLKFTGEARKMTEPGVPWKTTLGEWLDALDIDSAYKQNILTPWLASLTCGNTQLARTQSARAHLTPFAKTFPSSILETAHTYNSSVGLEGYLRMLLARCENTTVLTRAAVRSLEENAGTWHVRTEGGRHGPYDAVVVTAPPHISKDFFADVPGLGHIAEYLSWHEYYPSRLVIHRDPVYMNPDEKYWSVQNAAVKGEDCEASVWIGDIYGDTGTDSGKLSIFKSWAARRTVEPAEILAERRYMHPLSTPRTLGAVRDMAAYQGDRNLYFAGSFTTITDLQETALYSAMGVAKALNADGPELTSFTDRLSDEGKLGISYDVV